jgi:hypothetical protein
MHSRKVLVLASEPMLAAFLGMMLELESYEPAFANVGERPEDALTRVRPVLVVLLHSELDAARSDLFFARAARSGARIVVFGGPDADADLRSISQARRVPYFSMPVERAVLANVIGEVARDIRRSRSPDDRREKAWDAPDGTLHFADETGQVWKVYDRRGMERRAHPAATLPTQESRVAGAIPGRTGAPARGGNFPAGWRGLGDRLATISCQQLARDRDVRPDDQDSRYSGTDPRQDGMLPVQPAGRLAQRDPEDERVNQRNASCLPQKGERLKSISTHVEAEK